MLEMNQLAELRTVYPEGNGLKFEDLLNGIRRDTLIRVSTHLIGQNLFTGGDVENSSVVEGWFSEGNKGFGDEMTRRIGEYERSTGKKLTIVYNISCLKILQHGLELGEQGLLDKKSNEQSEIDLFLAMLALNQNEDYNQTKDKDKLNGLFDGSNHAAALMLSYSFPTQDITNFHFADYNGCQIIKFLMLFEFLEGSNEGRELIKRFCHFFKLKNWQDYLGAVAPLVIAWTEREHSGALDMIIDKNENFERNYEFLERLALGDYIKLEDHDYIKLREKPLVQLDEVTFRIIHPLFIADKIYKGMFFLLKQLNEDGAKIIGNFRQWFTSNFSEGYCFREVIKYSFHTADALFFDDELKSGGIVGPPDGYIREGQNVYLLENKDILIGAKIKGEYDFEALVLELKKKLLLEGTRPVGIGQLMSNIRKLLNGENEFDKGFKPAETFIYPSIILHDPMFDAPGLNFVLNSIFQEELEKLKAEGLDVDRVKPLALINIDALIQVAPLLQSGKVKFSDLLEDYYGHLYHYKSAKTEQELEELYKEALIPFPHYMKNYLQVKIGEDWRTEDLMRMLLERNDTEAEKKQ